VINLPHLAGNAVAAVAARMGQTRNSVQKLWVRALAKLREAMEGASS
jgi:hypothetical protein